MAHDIRETKMTTNKLKRKSKLLSLILRHDPAKAGLTLDQGGWVIIDDLLAGLAHINRPISRETLDAIVAENDKKRFSISNDGTRIRAAQGHSVSIDMAFDPVTPPDVLYHGTASRFLNTIQAEGLKPMSRQYVHLSANIETARKVGQRHGKPVILGVNARAMHEAGHAFYKADNGVWLTDLIPPNWLDRIKM